MNSNFSTRRALRFAAALFVAAACSDNDSRDNVSGTEIDSGKDGQPSASQVGQQDKECVDKNKGAACGDADMGRHCIDKRCVFNTCGDGVKAGKEDCDDGNHRDGDGCDASCRKECSDSEPCSTSADGGSASSSDVVGCGDGEVGPNEECDDGNSDDADADACSNRCQKNVCGNKRRDVGEDCDDGNSKAGDGCSPECHSERCRNGYLDPGEVCDDGNQLEYDGCNNRCTGSCGDGEQQDRETCDDGNTESDDGCSSHCVKEICGDGIKQANEECDSMFQCANCKLMEDTCTPCEREHCGAMSVDGLDRAAGCLDNMPNPEVIDKAVWAGDFTPCKPVLDCAHAKGCADARLGGDAFSPCWCGSATADDCVSIGPAADSPCRAEIETAAGTTNAMEMSTRLADFAFPVGYAYQLIACEAEYCQKECRIKNTASGM